MELAEIIKQMPPLQDWGLTPNGTEEWEHLSEKKDTPLIKRMRHKDGMGLVVGVQEVTLEGINETIDYLKKHERIVTCLIVGHKLDLSLKAYTKVDEKKLQKFCPFDEMIKTNIYIHVQ